MASVFKVYRKKGITTEDIVFTTPGGSNTTVIGMGVANVSGQITKISVLLDDTYLLKNATVTEGSAVVPVGGEQKVVVTAGSSLKVSADNAVDVVCSVLEQS